MANAADITLTNNTLVLSGAINFSNVMSLYQASLPFISQCHDVQFDFSQLKSSDSSGVALMVEWLRLVRRKNKQIKFIAVSNDLLSIIKAAGLAQLLKVT